MLQPVILCGGDGTRLWPASRKAMPKQFMPLNKSTLFMDTIRRALALPQSARPLIVCNQDHRFLAAEQFHEACDSVTSEHLASSTLHASILLEPAGRNTAPAIALAALHLEQENPVMLILSADHRMEQPEVFAEAVQKAIPAAKEGHVVTFGVVPSHAETGYGYIHRGAALDNGVFKVAQFVEKPDAARAKEFVHSGEYYWNSGMFLVTAATYLRELELYAPTMLAACRMAYESKTTDLDFIRVGEEEFTACPADSIDYAIMEHTQHACVVPLPAPWSDLGSWGSLHETAEHDERGNAAEGDVLLHDCTDSFFFAQSRLVTGIGLTGMVVVETPDAIMVAPKDNSQGVKTLVASLKKAKRTEAEQHSRVYRPWGNYESLIIGDRFQVKRIVVTPGQRLSLQKHYHRAEHWVVVRGTATVTVGEKEILLKEDQSTYIPIGEVHRLENKGKLPLEIIEIQTGSYLGEDDIVRLEDIYGR